MRNPELESIQVVIPKGRTLRVREGAGFMVRVAGGTAWLTEERKVDDTVLRDGESYLLERAGLALVFAFTEVRLEIGATGPSKAPAIELGSGYREISSMIVRAMMADSATRAFRWVRSMLPAVRDRTYVAMTVTSPASALPPGGSRTP